MIYFFSSIWQFQLCFMRNKIILYIACGVEHPSILNSFRSATSKIDYAEGHIYGLLIAFAFPHFVLTTPKTQCNFTRHFYLPVCFPHNKTFWLCQSAYRDVYIPTVYTELEHASYVHFIILAEWHVLSRCLRVCMAFYDIDGADDTSSERRWVGRAGCLTAPVRQASTGGLVITYLQNRGVL
jgi:hypothetical protein